MLLCARWTSDDAEVANGAVSGYIIFCVNGINIHVSKIAVGKEFQRRGVGSKLLRIGVGKECQRRDVGSKLLQEALRIAMEERKSISSTLHVAEDNAPAIQLYRSAGYADDGLLVDYYQAGRHALKLIIEDLRENETLREFMARDANTSKMTSV
eukprot:gene4214-14328_t